MKIGMIFPGYGSQFVGMAKELYDESRLMQEYFEEASNCLNSNFVKLCFASSDAELARMENAYPALFLVSTSLAALLKQEGIEPNIVAGYTAGEFSAMHHAGGLSFPDGLYILAKYASLYQDLLNTVETAGLQITGLDAVTLNQFCKQVSTAEQMVYVAVSLSPECHCVMGQFVAVQALRETLFMQHGVTIADAPLELGLHSTLMDPVVANFKLYLEKVDFKTLVPALISSTDARIITHGDEAQSAIIKHLHAPILWYDTLARLGDCDLIIEVGPGSAARKTIERLFPDKMYRAIHKRSDIEELKLLLASKNEPTDQVGI